MTTELPRRIRVRRTVNRLNLSTALGLAVARRGGARVEPGPHGLLLAFGYPKRAPVPNASAVTIGDVVLLRRDHDHLAAHPELLVHEARHSGQYAWLLGPFGFLPLYGLASAWSWLRSRDPALHNLFEVRADLVRGGYLRPDETRAEAVRRRRERRRARRRQQRARRPGGTV